MSTPHLRNCPKVNCNQKNDCCPFRKIVIPAVMGDDSEDSPSAPENGAYRNALVEYEANGAMYIYASDGIYTKISMVAGGHGTATIAYVDTQVGNEASARAAGDSALRADIPTETSQLVNDSGFITTEHDPIFEASPASGITTAKMTSWDNKSDFSGNYNDLTNKPNLATVATTGSYNDLVDRPPTPTGQVQSDWTQLNSAEPDFIKHKPALSAVAISGSYTDLLNQPTLATVATSGSYNDLSNKPTIPAAQINSDWNAASGISQILNKPNLATVATSGSYNDLSNKPTIPAAQVNSDWNASSGKAQILNKPAIPVITMQSSDPGEGATLAANNFIAVYVSGS